MIQNIKIIIMHSDMMYFYRVCTFRGALFHLTLNTHFEGAFAWTLTPHSLMPHCFVTQHVPATRDFDTAIFDAALCGDAAFTSDARFLRHTLIFVFKVFKNVPGYGMHF